MSESRLFTSSLTRREMARRRPARGRGVRRHAPPRPGGVTWRRAAFFLFVIAVCLAAFAAGHHGL